MSIQGGAACSVYPGLRARPADSVQLFFRRVQQVLTSDSRQIQDRTTPCRCGGHITWHRRTRSSHANGSTANMQAPAVMSSLSSPHPQAVTPPGRAAGRTVGGSGSSMESTVPVRLRCCGVGVTAVGLPVLAMKQFPPVAACAPCVCVDMQSCSNPADVLAASSGRFCSAPGRAVGAASTGS